MAEKQNTFIEQYKDSREFQNMYSDIKFPAKTNSKGVSYTDCEYNGITLGVNMADLSVGKRDAFKEIISGMVIHAEMLKKLGGLKGEVEKSYGNSKLSKTIGESAITVNDGYLYDTTILSEEKVHDLFAGKIGYDFEEIKNKLITFVNSILSKKNQKA